MISMRRRAFTLIELLTVMAISAILLGLIIVPLFQSFNLTRTAQAFADAQDRARVLTERISREIGNAALVRGSGGVVPTTLNGTNTEVPANTLIVRVPRGNAGAWPGDANNPVEVALPFTKLDLMLVAEGDSRMVGGAYVDPVTGKADPTLKAPKGQVNLPAAPGMMMARYFVSVRDPYRRYTNPYDGLLMARGGERDNLFGLYRAEVPMYEYRNNKNTPGDDSTLAYRPNDEYFESDDETDTRIVDLDDPRFILADVDATGNRLNTAKNTRIDNWMRRATLQTDVSRYDMILPVFDRNTRAIRSVAGQPDVPRIVPLIQFRPTRVNSDPAEPMLASRPGEESDDANAVGSDVYMTQYGLWGNVVLRVYPRGWRSSNPDNSGGGNEYLVAHRSPTNPNLSMSLYAYDPESAGGGPDFLNGPDRELFDIALFDRLSGVKINGAGNQVYPFTQAVAAANGRSGWLANADFRRLFTPVTFERNKGRVLAGFGIDEVGNPTTPSTTANPQNLPLKPTGLELTPAIDTDLTGNFYDDKFRPINKLYNKIFNDYPSLRAGNVHRFIDLRATAQGDGTPGPLFPNPIAGVPTGFVANTDDGGYRSKVTIVSGSDIVIGPDQLPGPNQGGPVRYNRIARGEPGPNQYTINYTDLPEPTNSLGQIDYSVAFPDLPAGELTGFNPRVYNPNNLISAVIQPRYKVGYIKLYSGSDVPLMNGTFQIYYKFQFTSTLTGDARERRATTTPPGPFYRTDVSYTDTITVDYDTRQLLDVQLTIRNYPQSSAPNPQTVTLKSTATVRNFTR